MVFAGLAQRGAGRLLVVDLGGVAPLIRRAGFVDLDVATGLDLRGWGFPKIAHGLCSSAKIVPVKHGQDARHTVETAVTCRAPGAMLTVEKAIGGTTGYGVTGCTSSGVS